MEKEFVTYELSKRLYLLGYNERNIYHYCNGLLQEGITYNSDDHTKVFQHHFGNKHSDGSEKTTCGQSK